MHIYKIDIKNFRLLRDVSLTLEADTTTIVGRNNSGKTSLTELFRRTFAESSPSFDFEDFSLASHEDFWNALNLKLANAESQQIRDALPFIEIKIWINYESNAIDLGPLGDWVIDLVPECTQAVALIRYQLKDGSLDKFFNELSFDAEQPVEPQKTAFCKSLKERVMACYAVTVTAIDPNDPTNVKTLDRAQLRNTVFSGFINAQRGLDDVTNKDRDVLGKVLEALLGAAMSASATAGDQLIAGNLKTAVEQMQASLDGGFNKHLNQLLPAFAIFGYPGLADPEILTETTLDVERLLSNHTRVLYAGVNGINLPEAYNGLGTRNLIFILLRLLEFYKSFIAQEASPSVHVIFIEEPEVHLHPQMAEVFVAKLNAIAEVFASTFNNGKKWPVQFVVTTHSSHVANRAPFESIRYFLATSNDLRPNIRFTQIKDLRAGLSGQPAADREFLHKYMTLTRCDLLFADKAVLIEGPTERILLPEMIRKLDAAAGANDPKLSSQYVSVVEVGGAFAHLFLPLVKFLELRTLVITDLDSINAADSRKACVVAQGSHTSNECIKAWFGNPDITPALLLQYSETAKTIDYRRIAFQVPEFDGGPCGRSFEDAFALANQHVTLFAFEGVADDAKAAHAFKQALGVGKKSDFALRFAIQDQNWTVPRYIREGLNWLARGEHSAAVGALNPAAEPSPPAAPAAAVVAEETERG